MNQRYGKSRKENNKQTITGQIRTAAQSHPLAFLVALPFGGFVPVSIWCLTHLETLFWWHWGMVAGGALFSSLTVIQWGERILDNLLRVVPALCPPQSNSMQLSPTPANTASLA